MIYPLHPNSGSSPQNLQPDIRQLVSMPGIQSEKPWKSEIS